MSPTAFCSAEKTSWRPFGEKSGDSGASTIGRSMISSVSRVTTFWSISDRYFPLRTKYAMRSSTPDQDIHGTAFHRAPGS